MLGFFRTIRKKLIEENSVRKYLLYAIGEILLVVIGMLCPLREYRWVETSFDHQPCNLRSINNLFHSFGINPSLNGLIF
ncbi:MAG: hypothetical protein GVY08_14370 [Bacteroidetes bacterium]|jgi:hypothetical protein|nr:hypothetical protein [Bacteroidota bacterium]